MIKKEKPLCLGAEGANGVERYLQCTTFSCQNQAPISWLIRLVFIENLISKPYTRKRSLEVDRLLVLAESLEEAGHAWN